jgi:hypothetical protein
MIPEGDRVRILAEAMRVLALDAAGRWGGETYTLSQCRLLVEQEEELQRLRGSDGRCDGCGGRGRRAYGDTTTWRGGVGGQMVTEDVCCTCWGSGDFDRPGANLRKMSDEIESGRRQTQAIQDDLAELLRELGLGDHARPTSPHQVMVDEIVPAVRALVDRSFTVEHLNVQNLIDGAERVRVTFNAVLDAGIPVDPDPERAVAMRRKMKALRDAVAGLAVRREFAQAGPLPPTELERLRRLARALVSYHTGEGLRQRTGSVEGCSNCGGSPHRPGCHVAMAQEILGPKP